PPNTLGRRRPFASERVALAGKLSSMSRGEASRLITEQGGELVALDNPELTLIVRGDEAEEAESLPARSERMVVIDETQFLRRLGLLEEDKGVSRLYTPGLLAKMVDVEPRVIRRWHRRGYLVAV